jgi:hypothetical protein
MAAPALELWDWRTYAKGLGLIIELCSKADWGRRVYLLGTGKANRIEGYQREFVPLGRQKWLPESLTV